MTIERLHKQHREKIQQKPIKVMPNRVHVTCNVAPGHVQQNRYQQKGRARKGRTNIMRYTVRIAVLSTGDILQVQIKRSKLILSQRRQSKKKKIFVSSFPTQLSGTRSKIAQYSAHDIKCLLWYKLIRTTYLSQLRTPLAR